MNQQEREWTQRRTRACKRGEAREVLTSCSNPTGTAEQGDIVLVGLRDFQDDKADVILKYLSDEARALKAYGELPDNIRVNENDAFQDGKEEGEDDYFDFEDVNEI